jgi:acylpyruvate hydrolase
MAPVVPSQGHAGEDEMKIARVATADGPLMAVAAGETLFAAQSGGRTFDDLPALLEAAGGTAAGIEQGRSLGRMADARLLAPVARPRKILCIGLNYRAHAAETNQPLPPVPIFFPKWDNAITGPGDEFPMPAVSEQVDYEAELAFVIGRRCKDVAATDAGRVVFGFTAANDVSIRDYQMRTSQWGAGKAFDGACPLGPLLVTADEVGGVAPDLAIRGRLEGRLVQDSRTSDLIFSVPQLVEFLSTIMTLEPGDLVLTGTPSGVGSSTRPPRWLKAGESFEVEIEGIGTLRTRFVPATAGVPS